MKQIFQARSTVAVSDLTRCDILRHYKRFHWLLLIISSWCYLFYSVIVVIKIRGYKYRIDLSYFYTVIRMKLKYSRENWVVNISWCS